jgi:hypothetical protein
MTALTQLSHLIPIAHQRIALDELLGAVLQKTPHLLPFLNLSGRVYKISQWYTV